MPNPCVRGNRLKRPEREREWEIEREGERDTTNICIKNESIYNCVVVLGHRQHGKDRIFVPTTERVSSLLAGNCSNEYKKRIFLLRGKFDAVSFITKFSDVLEYFVRIVEYFCLRIFSNVLANNLCGSKITKSQNSWVQNN